MAERFYTNHNQTEAWMVTDRTTRYVRVIHKNTVTGEEDFCICTKATTEQDETYIRSYAQTGTWEIFFTLLSQLLKTMGQKKVETERYFKVQIQ